MEPIFSKTAMFTGHRLISADERLRLRAELPQVIRGLYQEGIDTYLCGAAIGFDTLAGELVLELRDSGLPIRLVLAIPCIHQDALWSVSDRNAYAALMERADQTLYISYTPYYNGCMQLRNRYMVDTSSVCIAYFNGSALGGTASTCRMAVKAGRRLIHLGRPDHDGQLNLEDVDE